MPRPLTFYDTKAWHALRALALTRDRYRCVICDEDVSGKGRARVDHIQAVKTHPHLKLLLSNVRTLCTRCDSQAHRERPLWARSRQGGGREVRFVPKGCGPDGWPYHRKLTK